jgi:hypothetical protein
MTILEHIFWGSFAWFVLGPIFDILWLAIFKKPWAGGVKISDLFEWGRFREFEKQRDMEDYRKRTGTDGNYPDNSANIPKEWF